MAQKVQTFLVDDLDGSKAEGTLRFGLDGTQYEIDLNAEHAQELRRALAPYAGAGRKAGGAARRARRNGHPPDVGGVSNAQVRAWAKERDLEVKERGRVPAGVLAQYQAETNQ